MLKGWEKTGQDKQERRECQRVVRNRGESEEQQEALAAFWFFRISSYMRYHAQSPSSVSLGPRWQDRRIRGRGSGHRLQLGTRLGGTRQVGRRRHRGSVRRQRRLWQRQHRGRGRLRRRRFRRRLHRRFLRSRRLILPRCPFPRALLLESRHRRRRRRLGTGPGSSTSHRLRPRRPAVARHRHRVVSHGFLWPSMQRIRWIR